MPLDTASYNPIIVRFVARSLSIKLVGCGVKPLASGPSPCPFMPWHIEQFSEKSAFVCFRGNKDEGKESCGINSSKDSLSFELAARTLCTLCLFIMALCKAPACIFI